jgi:hypothetical protein
VAVMVVVVAVFVVVVYLFSGKFNKVFESLDN